MATRISCHSFTRALKETASKRVPKSKVLLSIKVQLNGEKTVILNLIMAFL